MLNISTSLISDVIGKDEQSAAFVYGAYSFFDKFANGILLFLVTSFLIESPVALKVVISLTPITCSIGAFSLTLLGRKLYSERLAKMSAPGDSYKQK